MKTFYFKGFEFRVIERDGDPWFVAKDVVSVLGIGSKPSDAVKYLDDDEHTAMPFARFSQVIGGESLSNHPDLNAYRAHGITLVNEPGLYSLVLRSRKERAREFKRWVTHEVLPAIRKTEAYVSPGSNLASTLASGDTETTLALLKQAVEIAETERIKRLEAEPRTLSATGAEKRTGGETVWNLRDAIADVLGVDTRQVYPALRMIGAVEKKHGGGYLVKTKWEDLLFDTETEVDGKTYKSGAPRVRPGKQSEFLDRVRRSYAAAIGLS